MREHSGLRACTLRALLLAAATLLSAIPGFAAPAIQAGEWEFTMTMEGPTMPMAIPPMRFTNCVTRKSPIPRQGEQLSKECKIVEQNIAGNIVTYTLRCDSQGMTLDNIGRAEFNGDTMSGTVKQVMKQGDKIMHTTNATMTGKRIGACNAKK